MTDKTTLLERLHKLTTDAEQLSADILAAYPNADAVADSIDLAAADLDEAITEFESFDPDAETEE